ncbi:uncharacterized protein (DUF1810 family) [Endobacter medicaginis]|uniref:DUF1810 domain-containing protein n=1 Tax=Endobacter medicaginis TaxID=1181271 RepID=A0A850NP50_9PROT|nr:DUF1810 family protein [Endobacter medicaginis]MBB3172319.1 uncharacterized protein (DUF1810 family) [Endobacter medicaginis]MCX5474562.1 DUF1810 family protein [Endobacter medicaginis]NVN30694.1 DUF1810 domain-containing protein [Endobacter medicaginis]
MSNSSNASADDPFGLVRFVAAQSGGVHEQAMRELRGGAKHTHWMWFIFPQAAGLGHSEMSRRYALSGIEEARAYLAHPVLGARYRDALRILDALPPQPAERIFGGIDALKLRSSLELFAAAAPDDTIITAARTRWGG